MKTNAFSLLHSRFKFRHATHLPPKWEGAVRDDSKNGCVADYNAFDLLKN